MTPNELAIEVRKGALWAHDIMSAEAPENLRSLDFEHPSDVLALEALIDTCAQRLWLSCDTPELGSSFAKSPCGLALGALLCGVAALENLRRREYEAADKQLTYMKHVLANAEILKKESLK